MKPFTTTEIEICLGGSFEAKEVIALYQANNWSSAKKPELLIKALKNSHGLATARISGKLVGLASAISDGYLVVYYPHMLVHPDYQGRGIGSALIKCLQKKYGGFHQQILVADGKAVEFYKSNGFSRAGKTEPMWIYDGNDH